MCNIDSFVDHIIGERLNDELNGDDYLVWQRPVVYKAVKEAVAAVYSLRPDLFAKTVTVTLSKGRCVHSLCHAFCRILDVITVDGCDCVRVEQHEDENDDKSLDFLSCYLPDCATIDADKQCAPDCYVAGDWEVIDSSPCTLRFKNPTPSDRQVSAEIMAVPIDALTNDLPCNLCTDVFQPIVDNTLFRLYSIDHKDGTALDIAKLHWQAYTSAMAAKFDVDYSLLENNYLLTRRRVDDTRYPPRV